LSAWGFSYVESTIRYKGVVPKRWALNEQRQEAKGVRITPVATLFPSFSIGINWADFNSSMFKMKFVEELFMQMSE